jgi:hypothetical protein
LQKFEYTISKLIRIQTCPRKRFNVKKVNNLEVEEQYQITISKRYTIGKLG